MIFIIVILYWESRASRYIIRQIILKLRLLLERQVRLLARRKVVLVIVEGVSEETALGIALSNVYDKDAVYIHIMHGDITT